MIPLFSGSPVVADVGVSITKVNVKECFLWGTYKECNFCWDMVYSAIIKKVILNKNQWQKEC